MFWIRWAGYVESKMISAYTLVAGLLGRSQYPEGPATGHLDTGFSWFPCVCKRMLRWFPRPQVATACFSCSPPDLNFLDPYFISMLSLLCTCIITTATGWQPICSQMYYTIMVLALHGRRPKHEQQRGWCGRQASKIVSWTVLQLCEIDPLSRGIAMFHAHQVPDRDLHRQWR